MSALLQKPSTRRAQGSGSSTARGRHGWGITVPVQPNRGGGGGGQSWRGLKARQAVLHPLLPNYTQNASLRAQRTTKVKDFKAKHSGAQTPTRLQITQRAVSNADPQASARPHQVHAPGARDMVGVCTHLRNRASPGDEEDFTCSRSSPRLVFQTVLSFVSKTARR